jgi:hypothetical protein
MILWIFNNITDMKSSYLKWSIVLLFLPFVVTAQVSKSELATFSHIKKELPQLKQTILSPKGEWMGQKVLLELYFFNVAERLSNIESSAFPVNAQELMPLNLKGVKQIDLIFKTPLMAEEEDIVTYKGRYNFNPQGNLEYFSFFPDIVELNQNEAENTTYFKYKNNLLVAEEKAGKTTPIYISNNYVLFDLTNIADDGEEISGLAYWEFDNEQNVIKRRMSSDYRMSTGEKHENRYASIYDAKSQTLNGYNVYTSYSQEGDYSSKKFTNKKQIPFEVIDGYEYPDSATACFRVEQKENIVLITQLQQKSKIREYKFVLNERKNIQDIFISNVEQTSEGVDQSTEEKHYQYKYTYY